MAIIRKRYDRWNAQVRRKNYPLLSKTFENKKSAIAWTRKSESLIDRKILNVISYPTLKEIITRYINEVSINKRGHDIEKWHLKAILKDIF